MRFSARLKASNGKRTITLEDAPRPTRIGYIKGILGLFVTDIRNNYTTKKIPLDTTEVHENFIALVRDEADPWDYDHQSSWGALTSHLKDCDWAEFYDFVELLGALLIKKEADGPFDEPEYFKEYQTKVNSLFQEDGIGWSLNDRAELYRQVPKSLAKKVSSTEAILETRFETARIHYQKAVSYLHHHPIDEANSIKEIVSAVESVARVLLPRAKTLGDAIKLMRKDDRFANHLIDVLEDLYVFSNATPLVRHGHVKAGSPALPEAELALFIGTAFIRYLIAHDEE